jgi:hypothetical protein
MSRSGLKWVAVVAALALVLLGAHLAWEWHRYRLRTPRGTVRVGMTMQEVETVLDPSNRGRIRLAFPADVLGLGSCTLGVRFDANGKVTSASVGVPGAGSSSIPRPSLFQHVRSWLPGGRDRTE